MDEGDFVHVFPAACRSISSAQSAIRSLGGRGTSRPSPLAGGRETKHAHSLERFAGEPLSQSSVLRFRNRLHRFSFKENPVKNVYTMTQPSCSGVTLPVCQRQRSTASWRASATSARFFCRAAALGFNSTCRQRWTALALGLIKDHAPGQFDQGPAHAGITGLGDGQVAVTLTGTADPAAQAGVTADLFAVLEARPVAEFGDQAFPASAGPDLWDAPWEPAPQPVWSGLPGGFRRRQ